MPEQSELVNYYLQSLQDNLAHMVKEKALDEAKLNFKDAEMGELRKEIEEQDRQLELLANRIAELELQNSGLKESNSKMAELENRNQDLENRAAQAQTRCATLTAKVDQAHRDIKERDAEIEKLKEAKKTTRRRKKTVDTVA